VNYYLLHTTYPILFLAVLGRELCLPVPVVLFLLSAGALVGEGKVSRSGMLAEAVLGRLIADLVWFVDARVATLMHKNGIRRIWCSRGTGCTDGARLSALRQPSDPELERAKVEAATNRSRIRGPGCHIE
jgi:hypothetical protein